MSIKWKTVWKFWSHVKVLGFVLFTYFQQHCPNGPLILFIHS